MKISFINIASKFQGMVNQIARDSPALLPIINQAIPAIFLEPHSIYLTGKVKDILFDGVRIYCNITKFPAKAVCTQMKAQIPGLKEAESKDIFLFSLLGTVGNFFEMLITPILFARYAQYIYF